MHRGGQNTLGLHLCHQVALERGEFRVAEGAQIVHVRDAGAIVRCSEGFPQE